jgi:DNA-binding protein HU-beta
MTDTLGKNDLVKLVAGKVDSLNQEQTKEVIETFLEEIVANVANGNKLQLLGFGSFEKKHKAASTGRNPKTGEPIEISARDYPKFTVGKNFKEVVNGE